MTTTNLQDYAASHGLERVGARPPLRAYLAELWTRRTFAATLSRYRIQGDLSESRLGLGWIVLMPLLNAALYGLIFGLIMPSSTRPPNFIPFLIVGVFTFTFFQSCFLNGAKSITNNRSLVRSLSFPRMLLPIASVLEQVFKMIPTMIVMAFLMVLCGEPISVNWLLAIPILLMMTFFNAGIAFIAARLTVHIRDVQQILPLIARVIFYGSGIFYSIEIVFAGNEKVLLLAHLNPVYDYIALMRAQFVEGNDDPAVLWYFALGYAVLFFVVGVVFFWKAEERYGHD